MSKPQEKDYTSHVAYCRALEVYCEGIETELDALKKQKPCASVPRCNLEGGCKCDQDTGVCNDLVDVYLAAGAQPVKAMLAAVPRDGA